MDYKESKKRVVGHMDRVLYLGLRSLKDAVVNCNDEDTLIAMIEEIQRDFDDHYDYYLLLEELEDNTK